MLSPITCPEIMVAQKMSSGFCPLHKDIETIRRFECEKVGGLSADSEKKGSPWGIVER